MSHTCPDCGTELTPETTSVRDGDVVLTATDAIRMLSQDGDQMRNVTLECGQCGWSVNRTVTIRTIQ